MCAVWPRNRLSSPWKVLRKSSATARTSVPIRVRQNGEVAPILLRSTTTPGKIKIHADVLYPGTHSPTPCDLEVESVPADYQFVRGLGINASSKTKVSGNASSSNSSTKQISDEEKQRMLQEVQDQQADSGVTK